MNWEDIEDEIIKSMKERHRFIKMNIDAQAHYLVGAMKTYQILFPDKIEGCPSVKMVFGLMCGENWIEIVEGNRYNMKNILSETEYEKTQGGTRNENNP